MDSRVISKSVVAICIEAILGEIKYPSSDIFHGTCVQNLIYSVISDKL